MLAFTLRVALEELVSIRETNRDLESSIIDLDLRTIDLDLRLIDFRKYIVGRWNLYAEK